MKNLKNLKKEIKKELLAYDRLELLELYSSDFNFSKEIFNFYKKIFVEVKSEILKKGKIKNENKK